VGKLQDFRQQYPQYDSMSDADVADKLHRDFYSTTPKDKFYEFLGVPPAGYVERGVDAVQGVVGHIGEAIQGTQDPAYKDVGTYLPRGKDLASGQAQAKTVAFDDTTYANILKHQLGPHFKGLEHDANGYPVLVYTDGQGQERKGYVNKPGLDLQDVDRLVSQAVPFILGGSVVGNLGKGLGVAGKALLQAVGQGGASVGADVAASAAGGENDLDWQRALLASGLGASAEVLGPTLTAAGIGGLTGAMTGETPDEKIAGGIMGTVGGIGGAKAVGSILPTAGQKHLGADGKIASPEARLAAHHAGIDLDTLDPAAAAVFAGALDQGYSPIEVANWFKMNRFGIESTKGQRTKDPEQLAIEKGIRTGQYEQPAKDELTALDERQKQQIQDAALTRPGATPEPSFADRRKGVPGDPYKEGMGAMISPTRGVYSPEQTAPGAFGNPIAENIRSAKGAGDQAITKAYDGLEDVMPKTEAFEKLGGALQARLARAAEVDEQTPAAASMIKMLEGYSQGKPVQPVSALLGPAKLHSLEQMRRRLWAAVGGASTNSDRGAATAIAKAYDDWVDEITEAGLIAGKPETVAAWRTARGITRDVKDLFEPRGNTPEAKILAHVLDENSSAESIVGKILGSGGPTTSPAPGSIQALNRMKKVLVDGGTDKSGRLIDPEVGLRTWNDIRMAYWSRLVVNKHGQMNTPTMIVQGIDDALRNQHSLVKALFSPDEMKAMVEFRKAVAQTAYKDPNPSGTATTLLALLRNPTKEAMRQYLKMRQQRETFSKQNFHMARIYNMLAKYVPDVMGTKRSLGQGLARKATSQTPMPKQPTDKGGLGGWGGATLNQSLQEPEANYSRKPQ
jgi:hypothetical protein